MILEDWKIKIAVLWLFLAVAFTTLVLLGLIMPGGIEQLIAGEIEGMPISEGYLLFIALFWLIPLTMAYLSLTLKDSTNRWANIIVGIVWVGFGIYEIGDALIRGWLTITLVSVSKTVAAALIVWYAWKSKQKA